MSGATSGASSGSSSGNARFIKKMQERYGNWADGSPPDVNAHYQCLGGKPFYPFNPSRSIDCITPETIAIVLSRLPRFGGRTKRLYTVAEHSLLVSAVVPPRYELAGLLHDAHEAFTGFGDVCGVHKPDMVSQLEADIDEVICRKFGLSVDELWSEEVEEADRLLLQHERMILLESPAGEVDCWSWLDDVPFDPERFGSLAVNVAPDEKELATSFHKKLNILLRERRRSKA